MRLKQASAAGTDLAVTVTMWSIAAVLMVLLLCPAGAWAQGSQILFLSRSGGSRNVTSADRSVGRSDCASNEIWRFRVSLPTAAVAAPQVWVGNTSTCESANREPSPTATCWAVCGSIRQTCDVTLGAGLTTYEFSIPASRLIDPVQGDCARADIPQRSGGVGSAYLLMTINDTVVATYTNAATMNAIAYDVVPPEPPTNISAQAGESQVTVRWDYTSSTTTTTADGGTTTGAELSLQGFYVLCDPAPGTDGDAGVDSGLDGSTGADAASDSGVTCGTTAFESLNPNDAVTLNRYKCSGTNIATAVTRSMQVGGLSNGSYSRFAVVAEDLAGNRSMVGSSAISRCVAPGPITDFWEYYRERGGQASPGYCALSPGKCGRLDPGLSAALVALVALVLGRRRPR